MVLSTLSKIFDKKLTKEVSFYLITNFIQKISPFVILNYAALKLSSEDLGKYSYVIIIINFLQPFLSLELNRCVEYFFFKKGIVRDQMFSTILTILLVIFTLVTMFFYSFNVHYKFIGNNLFNFLPLYIIAIILYEISLTVFRNIGDKVRFFIYCVGHSIVNLLGFFLLINTNYFEQSWKIIFMPLFLATVMFGFFSLIYLFKNYNLKLGFKNVKIYIFFSSPFILFVFSSFISNNVDKYFTEKYIGIDNLGVLAITLTYCSVIKFFSNSFMKAYTPMYFQNKNKQEAGFKKFVRSFYIVIVSLTIISISVLSLIYTTLLPETYKLGVVLIPIISIAYLIRSFRQMFIPLIMESEKTKYIAIEVFITLSIGTLSTMFLVKNYGLVGAALALVVMQSTSLLYYHLIEKLILTKD